jgi:ASCH domain
MANVKPELDRLALGIRQPWIELILRGAKTIEVRTTNTQVRGPIYLYASRQISTLPAARRAAEIYGLEIDDLPRGVIVGCVELKNARPASSTDAHAACLPVALLEKRLAWELANPERFDQPLTPRFLPYGIWFYPFRRK